MKFFIPVALLIIGLQAQAQKIIYSEPDRDDSRRMNFEIIGKMDNHFLVYKHTRGDNFIVLYDNDMNIAEKIEHDYMPGDKLINVDFFAYPDFAWMIYQYQKKNIVHCMAAKIGPNGKIIGEPIELDTTLIGMANNKIYTSLSSEDKSRIIVFKINSKNRQKFIITTKLFDHNLQLLKKSVMPMDMDERNDYLGEFALDNEGNLIFTKFYRNNNESISKAFMVIKKAMSDEFEYSDIDFDDLYLDELRVKVDNFGGRYILNAFYYREKRGNIEGLYFRIQNKATGEVELDSALEFSDELRREARGDATVRTAFNDYFIRNITTTRDGSFLVDAEAYYTSSRGSAWNRWDYLYGSPYLTPLDYYYYSPYYSSWWYRSRFGNRNAMRYHADNIILLSLSKEGRLEWTNVVRKEQFDDDSDDRISYQVMNTGGQLHFLFNQHERSRVLLNDYTLTPDGNMRRNPTLKNLDREYEFLPKYGKQVSAKQVIVPCIRRNYICFAKIDYS